MTINIKIFLLCPVPENQKPINEYLSFKENFFLKLLLKKQKKKTNFISFDSFFIFSDRFLSFSPIVSFFRNLKSSTEKKEPQRIVKQKNFNSFFFYFIMFFLVQQTVCLLIFFFYFLQFFVYLIYLQKRFLEAKLIYEESSWYDSQLWNKPLALIKNDHFLCTQKLNIIFTNLLIK